MKKATLVLAGSPSESRGLFIHRLQGGLAVYAVDERTALDHVMAGLKPDVLVVDLALPGLRGVPGLPAIQQLSRWTKILVLTGVPNDSEGVSVLQAGAKGYCARTIEPRQLEKAVAVIQEGEIWASRKLVARLVGELVSLLAPPGKEGPQPVDPRLEGLTARQRVVADLISSGACNKEIAARLRISERTVKAHLTEAFRSAGVSDRLQLALLLKGHRDGSG